MSMSVEWTIEMDGLTEAIRVASVQAMLDLVASGRLPPAAGALGYREFERGVDAVTFRPNASAVADAQLAAELRASVSVVSLDCFPAHYTATLVDRGRTFRAEGGARINERAEAEKVVRAVVAQALAARKAPAR